MRKSIGICLAVAACVILVAGGAMAAQGGLPERVSALEAAVGVLQAENAAQRAAITRLVRTVGSLETEVRAL
jgi:hypothetical protein